MKAKIKYFGMIAEKLNCSEENIVLEKELNLRAFFERKYPELKTMNYKIAVNQELKESIPNNCKELEISFFPPFAGG